MNNKMDFESPDVEKDFPGLYASESGRKSNESDFSDGGDHEKTSKKDLLGRRKEKKEKKDRGYAALEGESSPEEDTDTKSPSKSKKTKSFKFPTKSKEKREKSRDKEKVLEEAAKHKELYDKEKKKEKEKERKEKEKREKMREIKEKEEKAKFKLESKEKLKDDKKDKTKDKEKEKVKDKDKEKVKEKEKDKVKEKDKEKVKEKEKEKVKEKDKDKKDRKLTKMPSTVTSGVPFEEIFTLGVALPIFGVPLHQSVERSRCHDDTGLPLVVRDSIDYLQAHGLKSKEIYRAEPDKIKLQQLRKLFTDRGPTFPYHWDVPVACAMLKAFISELPESILTQEFHGQFEQATAIAEPQREATMLALVGKLPSCNYSLLAWLMRHFESVVANEQVNHVSVHAIYAAMGAALNMSHNLLTYLIAKSDKLFPDVQLTKYVPPLLSLPPDFPESANEISLELRKQESLLSQIHAEMHAGFITPARDHQLWEAQRIVTQLKVCTLRKQESLLSQIHAEMHAGFITPARDHQLWEAQRIVTQLKRKLRLLQKSVEPNALSQQQPSIDEKDNESRRNSQNETNIQTDTEIKTPPDAFQDKIPPPESPKTEPTFDPTFEAEFEDNFDFKTDNNFDFKPDNSFEFKADNSFEFKTDKDFEFKADKDFEFTADKDFEFKADEFEKTPEFEVLPEPIVEKPKLTEKELKILRLELENAEYLQLKSLLQAKINSEQFEIVKLRSHVALKNKQENLHNKESKEALTPEDLEVKQKLMKENAMLEQKRLNLINQIFQERVACIQLKIELAMKEILSKA